MVTQEQIRKAAFEYAGQIAETDKRLLYAEDFIAGAQWALEQEQWVDVRDRLPEKYGNYIVYDPPYEPYICFFSRHFYDENSYIVNVTHWQPLPQKPKL